jgi:2-polyprenyl-3-methyl-5-hydroxy-6-metoxy-1,4-benzoquinol methylase
MGLEWVDVSDLSFNTLLLLEREQLAWLPGWLPEAELAVALAANPAVAWYLQHRNPDLKPWVEELLARPEASRAHVISEEVRSAELAVLGSMNDLVTYAVAPEVYDSLPFLGWDTAELTGLIDFTDRVVADIGAGTGRLTFAAAEAGARTVFAVEPVENLRRFLRRKARDLELRNVYPQDGLITCVPFPDHFFDAVIGGHVFGDHLEAEYSELIRVTRPGGMLILCPGNNDEDDDRHRFLTERGFEWSRFDEPGDGMKRKYWLTVH